MNRWFKELFPVLALLATCSSEPSPFSGENRLARLTFMHRYRNSSISDGDVPFGPAKVGLHAETVQQTWVACLSQRIIHAMPRALLNVININQAGCFRVPSRAYQVKDQLFVGKMKGAFLVVFVVFFCERIVPLDCRWNFIHSCSHAFQQDNIITHLHGSHTHCIYIVPNQSLGIAP